MNIIPTAVVRLNSNGNDVIASETGVGPVDAALKAIQKIAGQIDSIKIHEYRLESITGGSDAMAEVCVKIEDKNGNIISARKSGEDIVIASVEAMIDAINKMLLKKMLISNSAPEARQLTLTESISFWITKLIAKMNIDDSSNLF